MKVIRTSLVAAGIALAFGSAAYAQLEQPAQSQDASAASHDRNAHSLERIVQEHDDLSIFVRALEVTGLGESITGGTQYTAFAPTDDAFEELGGSVDELLAPDNREQLIAMLRAHIVADDVDRERAGQIQEALTLDGNTVALEERDGSLKIGDASASDSDVRHGNLRIYMIDRVLDRGESQVAISEEGRRPRG